MRYSRVRLQRWSRSGKRGETGQALVELAFSVSFLLLILLGAAEFGRFVYFAIELSNAAKAAAQYGSRNSLTAADIAGMQAAAAADAPEAYNACTNFTTTIGATSCSCVSAGVSTAAASCSVTCATGYLVQNLTVNTSAQCTSLVHPRGLNTTLTITGSAVQEVMQ
ncbi:MAG TPA: TadE/TadG family type IV pilus assembly protein [Terracidiphilus sp.]|jgi:Flp pilus assembly protein TadG|nr:TadE/TadG family type IV pilus assembly protein [Terracidiphilus sp.]